ncbi:hypothetical protein, partial [Xanthomonas graminis]
RARRRSPPDRRAALPGRRRARCGAAAGIARIALLFAVCRNAAMIELNPIRHRIADLSERVLSLRGFL